jgi:hypothetical protein
MIDTCGTSLEHKVSRCVTPYQAYTYIKGRFTKGLNQAFVRELESAMSSLRMKAKETTDDYVCRAEELQAQLKDNERPVLPDVLIDRVVGGLPDAFNSVKVSLRILAEGKSIDELRASIARVAASLSWVPGEDVPSVHVAVGQAGVPRFGKGKGSKGVGQRKVPECWNCGEFGHVQANCKKPPKTPSTPAVNQGARGRQTPPPLQQAERPMHAGVCQASSCSYSGHPENNWIADSGASHHIIGHRILVHEYVPFRESVPITTAAGASEMVGMETVRIRGPSEQERKWQMCLMCLVMCSLTETALQLKCLTCSLMSRLKSSLSQTILLLCLQ